MLYILYTILLIQHRSQISIENKDTHTWCGHDTIVFDSLNLQFKKWCYLNLVCILAKRNKAKQKNKSFLTPCNRPKHERQIKKCFGK